VNVHIPRIHGDGQLNTERSIAESMRKAGFDREWLANFYAQKKAAALAQQEANAAPPPYVTPTNPNAAPPYQPPQDPPKVAAQTATGVPANEITASGNYVPPPDPPRPEVQLSTKPNLNPMGL
jgi:hypothetical protein